MRFHSWGSAVWGCADVFILFPFEHAVQGLASHIFVFNNLLRGARSLSIQVAARVFLFWPKRLLFPLALFHLWGLRVSCIYPVVKFRLSQDSPEHAAKVLVITVQVVP